MFILLEGARGAIENNNRFLSLVCAGFTALIAFQSFLIIGGVIKFIPLTGVTLPFVSYGGTSIVISYIIIAFMQWIIMHNVGYIEDKSAEDIHKRVRQPQTRKEARALKEARAVKNDRKSKTVRNTKDSLIPVKKTVERPARKRKTKSEETSLRPESYNRKRRNR